MGSLIPETREDCLRHQASISVCSGGFNSEHISLKPYFEPTVFRAYCRLSLFIFLFKCSHELMCPKLARSHVTPCNFQQQYQPLSLPGVSFSSRCLFAAFFPILLISSFFLFFDCIRVALHEFKIILSYVMLSLGATPQFILSETGCFSSSCVGPSSL